MCPVGTYTVSYENTIGCVPCPAGTYTDSVGRMACKLSNAGCYVPSAGLLAQSHCGSGSYSLDGTSSCTACGSAVSSSWVGEGLKTDCSCGIGNTGANCDIEGCNDILPGVSLGLLLMTADENLRRFTSPMFSEYV